MSNSFRFGVDDSGVRSDHSLAIDDLVVLQGGVHACSREDAFHDPVGCMVVVVAGVAILLGFLVMEILHGCHSRDLLNILVLLVLVLELGSSAHCHISTHMSEEYPLPFGVSFILGNALCASD